MDLDGAYDEANIFAKILRGEMPATKVWEDDDVLAIMDVFPQSDGHVLVLPKRAKARNLLDVDAATLAAVTSTVQRVARAVKAALKPDGLTIMQFNGSAGGQTIDHLHVHVIPRWHGQAMGRHGGAMADVEVLKDQAARIAAELA